MKKGIVIFPSIILCVLFSFILLNCVSWDGGMNHKADFPTGYPSGTPQRPYLYYGGNRYMYSSELWTDKSSLIEIGSVLKTDDQNLPDEEWEGSHLSVGQKVYIRTMDQKKRIYIEWPDNKGYGVFLIDESKEEFP